MTSAAGRTSFIRRGSRPAERRTALAGAAPQEHTARMSRRDTGPGPDYTRLPDEVRPDETVAGVDPFPVPDPHADRNVDQHLALRDD